MREILSIELKDVKASNQLFATELERSQ